MISVCTTREVRIKEPMSLNQNIRGPLRIRRTMSNGTGPPFNLVSDTYGVNFISLVS